LGDLSADNAGDRTMNILDIRQYVFILNFSLLLLHEMDAIHWKEWRLFGFNEDTRGLQIFVAAHLPLYALFLVSLLKPDTTFGRTTSFVFSAFLVIHFFLHLKALPLKIFNNLFSFGIISCIAVVSVAQFILTALSP
jgi:hypothetical protein